MNENKIQENAVSIYNQEGLDDFPVLKAFQQYIDAEQNKARKRMVLLCMFFGFLMTVVIAIFLLILKDVSSKNQALNDRLFEYVTRTNDRQPVVVQPPPAPVVQPNNDAALKAMTDTLVALQKQIVTQQEKPAAVVQQPVEPPQPVQIGFPRPAKNNEAERLAKAQAELKAEKEKLAAEKEKLHQQEVELHRRRLYPEYYEKLDRQQAAENSAKGASRPSQSARKRNDGTTLPPPARVELEDDVDPEDDDDFSALDDDELDELSELFPEEEPVASKKSHVKRTPAPAKPAVKKTEATTPSAPARAEDHYKVSMEIDGTDSDWLIPAE